MDGHMMTAYTTLA